MEVPGIQHSWWEDKRAFPWDNFHKRPDEVQRVGEEAGRLDTVVVRMAVARPPQDDEDEGVEEDVAS